MESTTTSPYMIREIQRIRLNKNSKILDVGSGIGQYIPYLKGEITAIDYDEKNLARLKKKYPKVKTLRHDLNKLPIPLKTKYDLIICFDVIEHLEKKNALNLIKELEKISKGVVMLSTPNINNFTSFLRFIFIRKLSIAGKPNFTEKIIFFLQNNKMPKSKYKYFVMEHSDEFSDESLHYHICNFSERELGKLGYKTIGGIGFFTYNRIPHYLSKFFDSFFNFFPYFSGSVLGVKSIHKK